ncbi:TetR family transcriptional regulator [Kaistia algarum]|uniref:TetR/AcrR family transcriptional regulator n=1 Tax=Kaistia algarum TaxID=2083279 RepID=UPI000CE88683|nr:TetR/AcrR family transcriptional regulator [Kaistia algarum]MCX5512867.1 TetR/AcrR family transcriptional regulator [Kaistia algarum]PPE81639.1 TetR family transcriptional regulator [Kaistia algarum]
MTETNDGKALAPKRADALKNRDHILKVAHDAFAQSGETSLNEIAKRAGIGAGTLYRHFPTREALILAVYGHDIDRLVASVADLLAAGPAIEAFRSWFSTLADYIRIKHGLGEALHSPAAQEAIRSTYAPVIAAIDQLIAACVAEGSMRAGVRGGDILILMGFLWRLPADAEGRQQAERMMTVVLRGLAVDV